MLFKHKLKQVIVIGHPNKGRAREIFNREMNRVLKAAGYTEVDFIHYDHITQVKVNIFQRIINKPLAVFCHTSQVVTNFETVEKKQMKILEKLGNPFACIISTAGYVKLPFSKHIDFYSKNIVEEVKEIFQPIFAGKLATA
ncbi:MAG: hypothetical protein OXR68_06620 [Alphaproteobacteria bacterium]|nr:hypothetical protein [Alphaproteobacteria bacterium]